MRTIQPELDRAEVRKYQGYCDITCNEDDYDGNMEEELEMGRTRDPGLRRVNETVKQWEKRLKGQPKAI